MMTMVIDKLSEVLASAPGAVLPAASIGARRPSNGGELPAIALSLHVQGVAGRGFGRIVRSGEILAQHRAVLEVRATPETFAADLRTLRIAPLPLKRHPASIAEGLTESDLQISNVTDPARPVPYRLVDPATAPEHYRVDAARAKIVFGTPQRLGDRLEVAHWTVTWRDDVRGDRYSGALTVEIWAGSDAQAASLSHQLQARLGADRELLIQKGFVKLQPARLEPVEQVLHQPATGSPFGVWRQTLGYGFVFEGEETAAASAGVPIARVDIDIAPNPPESFSVR